MSAADKPSFWVRTVANGRLSGLSVSAQKGVCAIYLALVALVLLGALANPWLLFGLPLLAFVAWTSVLSVVVAAEAAALIDERLAALPPGWREYLAGKGPKPADPFETIRALQIDPGAIRSASPRPLHALTFEELGAVMAQTQARFAVKSNLNRPHGQDKVRVYPGATS